MNRSHRGDSGPSLSIWPEELQEQPSRILVVRLNAVALPRCHLTYVDVKERTQLKPVSGRDHPAPERRCELLSFRLRGFGLTVPEGDPRPLAAVGEFDEHPTGQGMRERAHPVPAALASGIAPLLLVRTSHRVSPC